MRFIRDTATGKRVSRMNPADAWMRTDVPHLRIVDQALWDNAQHRLDAIRTTSGANKPGRMRFWEKRRPVHLVSNKVFCGCCGGSIANVTRDYLACGAARKQGTSSNSWTIRRGALERLILDALRENLMAPELVEEFVREFTADWNRAVAEKSAGRDGLTRELATVERKLNGLIDAISDGFRAAGLQAQLDGLEARRSELKGKLSAPAPATPRLHRKRRGDDTWRHVASL